MAQKKKEIVYLRKRARSNGTISLYLDICRDGKRTNEYLKLYLVPERTREDKLQNKETLKVAEAMRAKRIVEIQSRDFGVDPPTQEKAMFFEVMRRIIDRKDGTTKTSWQNCLAHLLRYEPNERITFSEITPQWVWGFREYLDDTATQWAIDTRKRDVEPKPLSQGTKEVTVPCKKAPANYVPAAAVIRRGRALSGFIGRKARVGGPAGRGSKRGAQPPEAPGTSAAWVR